MEKKRKIALLIIVILVILIIILAFIGGQTYAKYKSNVMGKGIAQVASWSFKVNDKEEKMQTINLASTINDGKILNNKIAPGTEGKFQIKLDASEAEVGINYNIKVENEKNKPQNLKFIYNDKEYNYISELVESISGIIDANAEKENKIKIIEISWKWEYQTGNNKQEIEENDEIDTKESREIKNYTFDVIVSGIQVLPESE